MTFIDPRFGTSASGHHGTNSRYINGHCRCADCTEAHRVAAQRHRSGKFAGRSDLSEFMRSLGWDRAIPRRIPKVFVDRWNREHPERPYIADAS